MRRYVLPLAAVVATLAAGRPSDAVVIQPDGTVPHYDDWLDYRRDLELKLDPDAEVLASRTGPFEIHAIGREDGRDLWVKGTLTHQVLREPHSGYLSFSYHFSLDDWNAGGGEVDFDGATIYDFGHYFVDFRTDDTYSPYFTRGDAAGAGNYVYFGDENIWDVTLLLRTNAPDFAEGGRFILSANFPGPQAGGFDVLPTFRPVPEPATAMLAALGGAALLLRRRTHSTARRSSVNTSTSRSIW